MVSIFKHIPILLINALLMSVAVLKEMSKDSSLFTDEVTNFAMSSPLMLGRLESPSSKNYFLSKN